MTNKEINTRISNVEKENKFVKPKIKHIKNIKNIKQTEYDKLISLFKQNSMFTVLLRKLLKCSDEILNEKADEFHEKLLNKLLTDNFLNDDKLFYKVLDKLSKYIESDKLIIKLKNYALCMIQKYSNNYKFAFYVKRKYSGIFEKEGEILEKNIKEKNVVDRLMRNGK